MVWSVSVKQLMVRQRKNSSSPSSDGITSLSDLKSTWKKRDIVWKYYGSIVWKKITEIFTLMAVVYLRFEYGTSRTKGRWVTVTESCLVICEGLFLYGLRDLLRASCYSPATI
jgi:hypothetical protein